MTLVFPKDRAAAATRAALDRGFFVFAMVLLGASATGSVLASIADPAHPLWLALPLIAAIAAIGWLLAAGRPRRIGVVALAIPLSAVALGGYVWIVAASPLFAGVGPTSPSSSAIIASPIISSAIIGTIMFATVTDRWGGGWVGTLIGYGLAQSAVSVALHQRGASNGFDVPALATSLGTSCALLFLTYSRSRARRDTSEFSEATTTDSAHHEREMLKQRSAALVHDTILNELAVLATIPVGPIPRAAVKHIRASVAMVEAADAEQTTTAAVPPGGRLRATLDRFASVGLRVRAMGDLGAVDALPHSTALALQQAVDQCLTNVLHHAGTDSAELVAMSSRTEVSVMIIDDGVGFDPTLIAADRLGLRSSVRGRITAVGGRVDLWSRVGDGTSIIMSVPFAPTMPTGLVSL